MSEDTKPQETANSKEAEQTSGSRDAELEAITIVLNALGSLSKEQQFRALEYVLRRLNLNNLRQPAPPPTITPPGHTSDQRTAQLFEHSPSQIHDIRTFKELKNPRSANEMAALVAFFVSEIAPKDERKDAISTLDLRRYFKMAGFPLPADPRFTLVNARNAGYLESAGAGEYKLNAVGYNLVAHRMENRGDENSVVTRGRKHNPKKPSRPAKKATRPIK